MINKTVINRYILKQIKEGKMDKEISLSILKEINQLHINDQYDIAITGMACRLPFANNTEEYWTNLVKGINTITLRPNIRIKNTKLNPTMKGGYLQDIDKFDASFFRIPPREAILMHPMQRLFLETAWEAIEDSGYANNSLYGSKTGVFVGIDTTCPFEYKDAGIFDEIFVMTGEMKSLMASRLSYIFNLQGPSFIVDSACSSGLVCIHLAIDSLKKKECNVALAGGINLITNEFVNLGEVESSEWKLAAFDKHSSGTVWGDGVAVLVLKPLDQAIKDRDNIRAIIKGSAINNDGKTSGITAPNSITQAEVIMKAWEYSGIDPETISYIEAHATGTVLGDPIEINGIKKAFDKYTNKKQFCGIGTVKPNIGHGVGTAGVSSLIKVILAMEKGQIPPNINFQNPNPFINFCNSPLYVNDRLVKWDTGDIPKRAGVNSFGFNRTNCHIVVEEAKQAHTEIGNKDINIPLIFTLTAKNIESLNEYIIKYISAEHILGKYSLKNICYTVNTGREHYNHRLAVLCKNTTELFESLKKIQHKNLDGISIENIFYNKHVLSNTKTGQKIEGEITLQEKGDLNKEAVSAVHQLIEKNKEELLTNICKFYVNGADIDWDEFYKDFDVHKVSLPTYPFVKKSYWKKFNEQTCVSTDTFKKTISHPLLNTLLAHTYNISIYLTELTVDAHWILTDHIIMGLHLLPGTGFIEIALACAYHYFKTESLEIYDVIFLQPLIVKREEKKEIHTIISKNENETIFKIVSKKDVFNDKENEWIIHAHGKMKIGDLENNIIIDINTLKRECGSNQITIDMNRKMGQFEFGPRWHNMTKYLMNSDKIYSELRMNKDYLEDAGQYHLHPAMFDNAINMAIQLTLRAEDKEIFLPFSFKSIKINKRAPGNFVAFQNVLNSLSNKNETIVSDIQLIDENNFLFAKIKKYSLKKIDTKIIRQSLSSFRKDIFYSKSWKHNELTEMQFQNIKDVIFITDNGPVSEQMINFIRKKCNEVFEIRLGDAFNIVNDHLIMISDIQNELAEALISLKNKDISHIFHTLSIKNGKNPGSIEELRELKTKCIFSLFYLVRNLTEYKICKNSNIIIISDYAHEVIGNEHVIQPLNTALCSFANVIKSEFSNHPIKYIDIDNDTGVDIIMNEALCKNRDFKVAYRNEARYTEELTDINIENIKTTDISLDKNGVYIITGGSGGIGLEISKYLTSKEKINIAFITRTPFPSRNDWDSILSKNEDKAAIQRINTIRKLEATGSKIVCLQGDVSDYKIMKENINTLRKDFKKINGIINCAGIPGGGIIINKDIDRFSKVLLPKIDGTWILDNLTANDDLDFFIMSSSILALIGKVGQSDYATANAYMDAFAVYRNKQRKKALAINWPPWEEVGMAKNIDSKMWGIYTPIKTQNAMNAFNLIFNRILHNVIILVLNYSKVNSIEDDLNLNVAGELKIKIENKVKKYRNISVKDNGGESAIKVLANDNADLTEIQHKIGVIFGSVLGLEHVNLADSFIDLGGDSIIAANLLKAIAKVYPGVVDLSDIFTYPTVKQITSYIEKKINVTKQVHIEKKSTEKHDNEVQKIMERLSLGEISTDEADELINKIEE